MFKRSLIALAALALVGTTSLSLATAQSSTIDCKGAKSGDIVTMFYQWSGEEETHFNNIMKPLVDACGIVLQPESSRDQALLDTKVQAGTPPDVTFWTLAAAIRYKDQ